jgi:hypothetical protein
MSNNLSQLVFQIQDTQLSPNNRCYRPTEWPPSLDWVVSLDSSGNPLSRWEDDKWDFSAWVGNKFKLDFVGGDHKNSPPFIGAPNQQILRLLTTWMLWGPKGSKSWATLFRNFHLVRRVIAFCESEGVLASQLDRFPILLNKLHTLFAHSDANSILLQFDRLQRHKDIIGTCVLGEAELAILVKSFKENIEEVEVEQTAYIPPRIWQYQNVRLRECLEDFVKNQKNIEECYDFCVEAYIQNYGSVESAITALSSGVDRPFASPPSLKSNINSTKKYHGSFINTAKEFDIDDLLSRWVSPKVKGSYGVTHLGSYLNLVQLVAVIYIANFTLQRKEEVSSLRSNCLTWEIDDSVGRFAIIHGVTTKTEQDDDAHWPTSPNVEIAVLAASAIVRMRMKYMSQVDVFMCSDEDKVNPYLFHYSYDPWSAGPKDVRPYSLRPRLPGYSQIVLRYPKLFALEVMRITEDDLVKARMFTPNLNKDGKFAVGEQWPIAFHQLRRTSAINMFASGLLSDSSIQMIMKHLTLLQTQYYGRNYTRMNFNREVEEIAVASRYEVMAKQIGDLVSDRYVSPMGNVRKNEIVVNLIDSKEFSALVRAGTSGEISFRETRLGGCTKRTSCEYGGIESIARCAGGDGDKPCRDAIFDKTKKASVLRAIEENQLRIKSAQLGSPRKTALEAEVQGLRNYLDAISK